MRATTALATGSLAVSVASGQVVQWGIERRTGEQSRVARRASSTITESILNEQNLGGYFATTLVGTPGQNLTVQLDTGSSDIWVPASTSNQCAGSTRGSNTGSSSGCPLGSFNKANSKSFSDILPGQFDIQYVDGSQSKGDYFTDVFSIGGATISNMTMGLGLTTDIPYGLVGIGYTLDEAIVSSEQSTKAAYANLPVQMMNEGLIATNAYSLWLNDLDSSTGSILFGGIDTEKYHGELTQIEIYKDSNSNQFTSFIVALTSIEAVSSSGSDRLSTSDFPVAVVLDSGTTLSYLPQALAEQVWTEVGAVWSNDAGAAVVPCSISSSTGAFTFGFGGLNGAQINVTMDELVLSLTSGGAAPTFSSGKYAGQDACQFGIQNATSDPFLLGDTFLRSAYVVYDLVNNQIALAPTDFNATATNVIAFASSGAPIPSATTAPSQAAVTVTSAVSSPTYGASAGFASGNAKSGASVPPVFEGTSLIVLGSSIVFMIFGSVFFQTF